MRLIRELFNSRTMLINLSKNDFKNKYSGSALGIVWGFVPPIMTILIYWFIFNIGFRIVPVEGVPYLLWLVSGLVPWFFFSESIVSATNSFTEYSYLVKKVVFKVSIIPLVKIISALFIHLFFIWILMYIFLLHGYIPSLFNLQLLYYTGCLIFLIIGISLVTATINVFFKDVSQIVVVILQFGVWLAPIMWNPTIFSDKWIKILKLNPLYYIIQGYRDSLIYNISIYERLDEGIYFWCIAIGIFILGVFLFKKLKPHFADLL